MVLKLPPPHFVGNSTDSVGAAVGCCVKMFQLSQAKHAAVGRGIILEALLLWRFGRCKKNSGKNPPYEIMKSHRLALNSIELLLLLF